MQAHRHGTWMLAGDSTLPGQRQRAVYLLVAIAVASVLALVPVLGAPVP